MNACVKRDLITSLPRFIFPASGIPHESFMAKGREHQVVVDPGVVGSKPVIKGTRISLESPKILADENIPRTVISRLKARIRCSSRAGG